MVLSLDRFIAGKSAEIGAVIAEQLTKAGLIVVGLARRLERLEQLSNKLSSKKGKFHPLKADITKEPETVKAFQYAFSLGPVHVLVNHAAMTKSTNLSEGLTEIWLETINTNVVWTVNLYQRSDPIDVQGHIVHINSVVGHKVVDILNRNVYFASKHAVTALTDTLRQEFNRDNVRIEVTVIIFNFVS